ncbi:TonB-dependent receptor [Alteromonas pelagimontana]|uniref:TonB-dependent receptor n=1 Tax=Alteromonas pelagimontana TaxID=1858656 RepID=UPI001E2CB5D0|nr:TonB-dependent receptor [Alteromonas pelagimontana]
MVLIFLLQVVPFANAQQDSALDIAFEAQPLSNALNAFSRATGQTILYDPAVTASYFSTAVKGSFTQRKLILQILVQSPLCADKVKEGWLVSDCPQNEKSASEPPSTNPNPINKKQKVPFEIEVTGFRSSLMQAREIKRLAMISQDAILAEDIADFPDLNLADSLQRVPGISITREAGEGRQISLRGLGPDFTRVIVNGMEAMGMTSSPMDARGAVSRTRAFDFNIFASELFNRIDVKKSYSADQEEGGIGGTVWLQTPQPFDYEGFQSALTYRQAYNSNSNESDPRVVAMISNRSDNIGALFSVAYSERHTTEYGTNTTRWRQEKKQLVGQQNPELALILSEGELWFPRGHRYSLWNNQQSRLGMTTSLQYRPLEQFSLTLNGIYSRLQNRLDEHHLAVKDNDLVSSVEWTEINGDKEVTYAHYQNATWRAETREDENRSVFYQFSGEANWKITPDLSLNLLIGNSSSDYSQPKVNKVNIWAENVDIMTDFRQDRFYGLSTSPGFDTTSIEGFEVKDLYFQENYMTSNFDNIKLSLEHSVDNHNRWTVGVNQKTFANTGHDRFQGDFPTNGSTPQNEGIVTLSPATADVFYGHPDIAWRQGNLAAIQAFYGLENYQLGDEYIIDASNFKVTEETLAAYGLYDWDTNLAGQPFLVSAGLRYFQTQLTSAGLSKGVPTEISRDYADWLPSLNMVYEFSDDFLWRMGVSENITRPSIRSLSFSADVSQASRNEGEIGSVWVGNPDLAPFESVNFDTALEGYFSENGIISLALFYKKIDNFIVEQAQPVVYASLGLPEALLQAGDSIYDVFNVTTPQNSDSSTVKGFEIAFSRDFDFLPAPFNQLGMVANYTWANGNTLYRNVENSGKDRIKTFAGLSKSSYNLTFYYEAERWAARISSAYRSDYILSVQAGNADQDEAGYHDTAYVDASAYYQISDDIKITAEGLNLTNVREELYSDSNDRAYNTTTSGRTFLLGISVQLQ